MEFKTKPYQHQLEEFENKKELTHYALFWEQGTGKTKAILDQVAHLYERGEINALFILAPNMIHINWIKEEIPTHLAVKDYFSHYFECGKAGTKTHQKACEFLIKSPGLSILAMNYDAIITKKGKEFAKEFLTKKKCFYVLDEATKIKSPGSKRTKTIVASGRYAKYKRIMTGTPVTQGAFDVYSPFKFLDENFWKRNGLATFESFKHYFGVFLKKFNRTTNREYNELLGYQRLDELSEIIKPVSSRVTKDEVLDLPPKIYTKRYFEMTDQQTKLYKDLKDEFISFLDSGRILEVPLALSRIMALHQVTCGYLPADENGHFVPIEGGNPRLETLKDICEDLDKPTIIWCRFRADIDLICEALGEKVVRFDGSVSSDKRQENLAKFKRGEAQFFISTTEVGGTGLTLNEASTVIYYSNNYKLENRLQSEDRCHRVGQNKSVSYIDIVAPGTVDDHIVKALKNKLDVASSITGDKVREWL